MRVQLAQQAQEILGKSDLVIITERVDDVALLIGQMVKIGFVEVLDRHIPRHWQQRELSWGWTAVIWLAYILTEGDHRKVSVEAYIKGMQTTLSHLSGQVIDPLDFSDDRLGHLLKHLSQPHYWHRIEQDLNARSLEVYAWPQDVIRWVLSQSSIFGQNPKIGCQEFNDLQTPQLSKKQLCDRTRSKPLGVLPPHGFLHPLVVQIHEAAQQLEVARLVVKKLDTTGALVRRCV